MKNEMQLLHGDCLERLKELPDNSVDSVVTDPPYGLSFMGKKWDYDVPSEEVWRECLRVLKPGGHLLAFAGTRTQHRMAVRIEDAGFEIRDMIAWVYGSGFPKSLDVSKAIDKGHGENRDRQLQFTAWMRSTGITAEQINEATGSCMASHYLTDKSQPAIATADMFDKLRPHLPEVPEYVERLVCERTGLEWTAYKQRPVVGRGSGAISTRKELRNDRGTVWGADSSEFDITAPATDAARQWQGWGTALKPAMEPITVARKPLIGTVAENVLTHGTGGLNVDGCRVGTNGGTTRSEQAPYAESGWRTGHQIEPLNTGRWPANLIHDGSEEPTNLLGDAARFFYCPKASKADRDEGLDSIRTVKHITSLCKSENMELAELLQKVTSESIVKWGIDESGGSITGLCLSDSLSTTLTEISKITTSQICNLWTLSRTNESTAVVNCVETNGGNRAENAEKSNLFPPNTTSESQAESAHGAKSVVSKMLSEISDGENWKKGSNFHATVKPTDLMRYLCRLVTPPGGVVLDPFMGSGSTGKAAMLEGFQFIGIEREAEYMEIAKSRIEAVKTLI